MKLKKILKYIILPILLGGIGFLYGFSNKRNSQQMITKSVVKFHSKEPYFLTEQIVNKLLIQNNARVKKQAKSVIDLYMLEEQVLENPYVEKVSLFITVDGNLNTVIQQREPIARILDGNSSYYVDSQAVKVPISENYSARVPVITGISNENEVSRLIVLLNKIVEETNTNFMVVTHHRLTMAKMDRLFGVTMEQKGISRLVSVNLAEAKRIRNIA